MILCYSFSSLENRVTTVIATVIEVSDEQKAVNANTAKSISVCES